MARTNPLEELGHNLKKMAALKTKYEKRHKEAQVALLAELEKQGFISIKVRKKDGAQILTVHHGFEGGGVRISAAQAEPSSYSAHDAAQVLDEEQLEEVTVRVVDKAKLEEALSSGAISPADAAKFTTRSYNAPYPVVTLVKE